MTGDQADMERRIRAVLPTRWFPDVAPVLDGLVSGLAWSWSWLYALLAYAKAQTRIATASGIWLDMIASDYFGLRVARGAGEADDGLRARISIELRRERGTRAAVVAAVADLTGQAPAIFEPSRSTDTGGWGAAGGPGTGIGYGAAGGWGSLSLPFQFFVTAYRPAGRGIAEVGGWGDPAGGYGVGAVEYVAASGLSGGVTDAAVYAAIADVLPVGAIAWTHITNQRQ
jgi:hypothetical protein